MPWKIFACVILILLVTTTAEAGYKVEIGDVPGAPVGSPVNVPITIKWTGEGPVDEIGAFDLNIVFENHRLTFIDVSPGAFLTDCGWASCIATATGTAGGDDCCTNGLELRQTQQIVAFATQLGSPPPTCFAPDSGAVAQIAVLTFQVSSLSRCGCEPENSPIDFYWRTGDCGDNTFSSPLGDTLYGGQAAFDYSGNPHVEQYHCKPLDECSQHIGQCIDFHGGRVDLKAADPTSRGDINLNGIKYEIADAVVFTNYFITGLSAFEDPPEAQIATTDINCDGQTLSVADLVHLVRLISGDCTASPCTGGPPGSPSAPARVAATDNTMGFYGASGRDGQTNVPFEFHTDNTMVLGGLYARVEFDPDYVTPVPSGYLDHVQFQLTSRSSSFGSGNAMAFARSPEPGVLLFGMSATPGGVSYPAIQPGSGPVIRVFFDVNLPEPPIMLFTPVQFVDEGYLFNHWSSETGEEMIIPTLVNGVFEALPPLPPPSCPVLYSHDGSVFVEQNTMLTACEQSGYVDVVTDYYQVAGPVDADNGVVRFEFREGEDEITFLHDVSLLTIDHSPDTRVACTVDGKVFTYRKAIAPLTAVDNFGIDRFASIVAEDGDLMVAKESGYLIVEFPAGSGGIGISAISKDTHIPVKPEPSLAHLPTTPTPTTLTVEYLDASDRWVPFPAVPPRDKDAFEFVYDEELLRTKDDRVTIKVAWEGDYSTDVIRQFIPSDEQPIIGEYNTSRAHVQTDRTGGADKSAAFVLRKGDVLQFEFETNPVRSGLERDYIIAATGRYEPDYKSHPELIPKNIVLHQNYPNPFNPATTITFSVPHQTDYTLQIFNITGQVVARFTGVAEPGIARVDWNASGLASGVYVYRLTAGGVTKAQKMMLLK